jgi:photosystem II stability/assembly factor-like uncharacterized protein
VYVPEFAIDPSDPQVLYVGLYGGGVYKTTDGGASWNPTAATLYAGTDDDGVYKTTDGGGTWTHLPGGLDANEVLALAVDPAHPRTVYAGGYLGGVHVSTDGGQTWAAFNHGLWARYVLDLAVTPDGSTVHAATGGAGCSTTRTGEAGSRRLPSRPWPRARLGSRPVEPILRPGQAIRDE